MTIEQILADIKQLQSPITKKSPTTFVRDGCIYVSAEDGNSSSEASGNVAAQNYDLITNNNLWRNPLAQSAAGLESTRFWFNKQNGYYLVYGTQQNIVGTTLGTVFSNDLLEGLVIASQRGAY